MTEVLPEMSLLCFSMALKFYVQNFSAGLEYWLDIAEEAQNSALQTKEDEQCVLYLKWDVSQCGLCSLVQRYHNEAKLSPKPVT